MKKPFSARRPLHIVLITLGIAAAVAIFYILGSQGIGIPCPFWKITGLQCPGCGNSRAALALLRLDLAGALGYNALCLPEFLYLAWVYLFACREYLAGRRFSYKPPVIAVDIALLIAVLLWGILRNCI